MRVSAFCTIFLMSVFCLGAPVRADNKVDAGAFANDLGHKALSVITDASLSKDIKRAKLETLFAQNVDINWIGKFVLGRYWREASDAQKKQYLANYKTFIIRHYTSNLSEFTNADFEVTKITQEDQGGFDVTMRIKRPQAEDTVVDYIVRQQQGGGLKVYDIIVEGVSMITTQRSEFGSVAGQKGIDYLIAQLERRSRPGAEGDATEGETSQR